MRNPSACSYEVQKARISPLAAQMRIPFQQHSCSNGKKTSLSTGQLYGRNDKTVLQTLERGLQQDLAASCKRCLMPNA